MWLIRFTRIGVLAAAVSLPSIAQAEGTPYLRLRAEQTKPSVDVGVSYKLKLDGTQGPQNLPGQLRLRPTLSVGRPDPDEAAADLSAENVDLGAKLELLWRFATRVTNDNKGQQFALGLDGGWGGKRFTFNPAGGEEDSAFKSSWNVGFTAWLFTSPRSKGTSPKKDTEAAPVAGTSPKKDTEAAPVAEDIIAWIFQPQIRATFTRAWEDADEAFVVRPPNAAGLQLAEKLRIDPPSVAPKLSVRLALPFQPPDIGQFALAPVARLSTKGTAEGWNPINKVSRIRAELWVYYFAFDATAEKDPALRIGVAPYVDFRISGSDKRGAVVPGVMLELRSGTEKLEY
jgi:hypothetical protein